MAPSPPPPPPPSKRSAARTKPRATSPATASPASASARAPGTPPGTAAPAPGALSPGRGGSDLHRLLTIIVLAQSGPGWSASRLARECGVVERTIYRDVRKLVDSGVPIEHDAAWDGYRVRGEFFLPPVQLTTDEALALAVLCEEVAGRDQIGFLSPALRALQKVRAQLPAEMRDEVVRRSNRVKIRTARHVPAGDHADVYARVDQAIAEELALDCVYEKAGGGGESEPFLFEPYALLFAVRAWYVVGRHLGRKEVRCLKLTRFLRVARTTRHYTIPQGFSIDAYVRNAWAMIPGDKDYAVEIRFEPGSAHLVTETMWHKTQELDHHADGAVTFRATVSGLDEIVWWVLSMGHNCRVVKPPELARRVGEIASRTAAMYAAQ